MFDGLRRAIGLISVKEERGVITVSGVPADVIARDISKIWSTSRVNMHMFDYMGRSGFSFKSFFAVEVHFILKQILEHPKAWTNQRALRRLIEELENETWLSSIVHDAKLPFRRDRLNEIVFTPKAHQNEFLDVYENKVAAYQLRGYMLAAAAGSGKTATAIMLSLCLDVDATVVIAPKKAVVEVWRPTFDTLFKKPVRSWTTVDNTPIDQEANWLAFHFETIDQAISWFTNNRKYKRVAVVLDECHNVNDPKSDRTQYFVELCKTESIISVLWMSGTPIKAIGNEAIPFLTTIDLRFTPEVQERFVKIFGKQASRAVEILANRIGLTSFKVQKSEVGYEQLSERAVNVKFNGASRFTLDAIRAEIVKFVEERLLFYKENERKFYQAYFELLDQYAKQIRNPSERKDYELYLEHVKHLNKEFDPRADKDIVVWCNRFEERYICPKLNGQDRKDFRHLRSIYKYVALKVRGEALGRILTKRRIECFAEMVPHSNLPELIDGAVKKTLIFTSYVAVADTISNYLKKEGYNPLVVYGSTNKNLKQIMQQYRDDPDANPLIATFDSLAEAVPVTEASLVVLMNAPFRSYEKEQAVSRAHRLGQDTPVEVVSALVDTGMEPNISTRSNEIMEWSKASVDAIMGLSGVDDSFSVEELEVSPNQDWLFVLEALVEEPMALSDLSIRDNKTKQVTPIQSKPQASFFGDF